MKARIKGTNIIVECTDIDTLINESLGIKCRHSNGATEVIPGDCLVEIENDFDWQSFRNQVAKDILCAMIARGEKVKSIVVDIAIDGADELIKALKEREEKL